MVLAVCFLSACQTETSNTDTAKAAVNVSPTTDAETPAEPVAKGFVIIFTCNSCPYAVKYEDRIIDLHEKYAAAGYPLIAINPNDPEVQPKDSFDKMITRAKEKGFEFPYVFDEGQKVYPKFGATKTPHIFILNKDRVVEYIGSIDNNHNDASAVTEKYVENAIAALEKGEKPNPSVTKAIGCSVKYKK